MDKLDLSRRLDAIVRDHRFTIAVTFPVIGAIILVASAEGWLPGAVAYHPALLLFGTAVMRTPLLAGLLPLLDRRAIVALLGLLGYTYAIEILGVETGLPYGEFAYQIAMGPMLFGVPLALPLFFIPLVANAYLLILALSPSFARTAWLRIPVAVGVVLAIDLVLDPAAVAIGFWAFEAGGAYYGVPWTNYAGWILSGTVGVLAIEAAFRLSSLLDRLRTCEFILDDLVSFTLLWGTINALYGNWIPVLLTIGFLIALDRADRLGFLPAVIRDVRRASKVGE